MRIRKMSDVKQIQVFGFSLHICTSIDEKIHLSQFYQTCFPSVWNSDSVQDAFLKDLLILLNYWFRKAENFV